MIASRKMYTRVSRLPEPARCDAPALPQPARVVVATCSTVAAVERQQLAQRVLVGDIRRPTVRGSHSRVKSLVRISEPLRPGVVEVRQRALLERPCRLLVARYQTLRVAGNRLVDPLDPFGRVEPAVPLLDQPLSFQGFRRDSAVTCGYLYYFRPGAVPVSPTVSLFLDRPPAGQEHRLWTVRDH